MNRTNIFIKLKKLSKKKEIETKRNSTQILGFFLIIIILKNKIQ